MVGHSPIDSSRRPNQQVGRPSNDQVQKGLQGTPQPDPHGGSELLQKGVAEPQRAAVRLFRNVSFSKFHVIGVLMVDGMGSLPTVIGHQEQRMQAIADGVLNGLVLAEGTVTTFVRQHPQSHGDSAGDGTVGQPKGQGQDILGRQDVEQTHADGGAQGRAGHRDAQISQRRGRVGFEAFLGNDRTKLPCLGKVVVGPSQGLTFQTGKGDACHVQFVVVSVVVVVGRRRR